MMKPQTGPIDLTEDNSDSEEDGDVIEEEDDEDVEEVDSSELDTEMDSSHMIHTEWTDLHFTV